MFWFLCQNRNQEIRKYKTSSEYIFTGKIQKYILKIQRIILSKIQSSCSWKYQLVPNYRLKIQFRQKKNNLMLFPCQPLYSIYWVLFAPLALSEAAIQFARLWTPRDQTLCQVIRGKRWVKAWDKGSRAEHLLTKWGSAILTEVL